MDNAIHIKNLNVQFDHIVIFDAFDLEIRPNEHWAILGRSGVGKSTLIYAIAGLLTHATGQITNGNGHSLKNQIAWLAQKDSLLPWLSVKENVALSAHLTRPFFSSLSRKSKSKALELLEQVGLEKFADVYPDTLSGGQRQRVALARTLYSEKSIVLMDEPFSALDAVTKLQLQDLTAHLLKNKTVLLITHDPLEALRLADVVTVMRSRPAQLTEPIRLSSPAPRNVEDPNILRMQGELLQSLRQEIEQHDSTKVESTREVIR